MAVSVPRTEHATPGESIDRNGAIPPLEDGDRLTREEFERRYDAMPQLKKAELIEGVVHLPSPDRHRFHGAPHSTLIGWLFNYRARTPGVELSDNSTVHLSPNNIPQPDCLLFIQPEHGGRVMIDKEGYIVGAPDLIAEVTASTESYDLHDKRNAYRRSGVLEYLVWRVRDREIDWFVLRKDRYKPLPVRADGSLRSTVFPGLWLDPAALIDDDLDRLMTMLQRGLDSPEHVEFVAGLREKRAKPAR